VRFGYSRCPVANPDEPPTGQEQTNVFLLAKLRADGNNASLIALLQRGREGRARLRDALTILGELDPDLIVRVAVDALIQAHAAARQTHRAFRDST
jgi:hypothetical protein